MTLDTPTEPPPIAWAVAEAPRDVTRGLQILGFMVVALAALTWLAFSVPGAYFLLVMFLPFPWLLLGAFWLVAAGITMRKTGLRAAVRNGWLLGMAAIVLVTATAVLADIPLRARFAISRPALDALAAEMVPPSGSDRRPDGWIGAFEAERIGRFSGGFRFLVKGTGFLDPVGFAYSPDGPPPNVGGEDRYEPFDGSWWIWIESW